MASASKIGRQRNSLCLTSVLSSAVLEWLLMFLLFLNALFSYLITKFARSCKLQTPCLLCSRLDHVFGNEKPGFYKELFCDSHKAEISSWAYCGAHKKLDDVNKMYKDSLLSFAINKKSNHTFSSLAGEPGANLDNCVDGDSFPDKLNGEETADRELGMSFSNSTRDNCLNHQDRLSKKTKNSLVSPSNFQLGNNDRIGNNEVRSDNPLPDNNDEIYVAKDVKEDLSDRCLKPEPALVTNLSISLSEDTSLEKSIHPSIINRENSLSVHVDKSYDVSLASTVAIGHDSEGSNCNTNETTSEKIQLELSNGKFTSGAVGLSTDSIDEHSKPLSSSERNDNTDQVITSDPSFSGSTPMDLNDAYKLAIGSKGSLASPRVTEIITGRDSSKAYEDMKLLMSQFSYSRGLESTWSELSPSPSPSPSSAVLQNITKTLSIERNESGFESLDGSMVSEIEGETAVERLKRQVELDRKSIYILYKELEEERNASAIAANQAMAMITRLQEEKAAMQMEALQYQRMMEEQAEYDQEAIQKLNELLVQRDKEIEDLVAEVERYKKRAGDATLS